MVVHAKDAAAANAAVVCARRLVSATLLAEARLPTLCHRLALLTRLGNFLHDRESASITAQYHKP